jgi:hypothetical protein
MTATDKKEELYLYLGLQIGFIKPIEQVLKNLKEGVYEYGSDEAMNILNEKLQNLTNSLLTALKVDVKCPKIEGTFTKENEKKFIKYFSFLQEQYNNYLNILNV